ncbi:hypothetical protein [Erysipelothrix aquatica]|uniref:hypothetical protein n=2 Tax=Erysipelothrix aquatica TaxID=2683714 RepID=UPI001358FA2C|nr:hypothetical protein [Erysipelothrix aquatica]
MMTQKQDPKIKQPKNKTKKKHDWSFYAIIVCLVLIAIPTVFLGYTILSATGVRGEPIIGNRFDGDLTPAIETTALETIQKNVEALGVAESVKYELETATVRINVKVAEGTDKDAIASIANQVYETTVATLPVGEYFTASDSKKMYDIEINVYNMVKPTEEQRPNFIYYIYSKSSKQESPVGKLVSEATAPEFVEKLRESESKEGEQKEAATDTESGNDVPSEEGTE